jgi:hypothetical protein
MAIVTLILLIPVFAVVGLVFIFFREVIREHFRDMEARNLGVHGKIIFAVDALFMFGVFCMVTMWLCHTIWK